MKKIMIVAGLLALSSVAASAASPRTSKAVPLNETQMKSVKGQAYLYVYVWNGSGYVTQIEAKYIGYTGYAYQIVYTGGGPRDSVQYVGVEYPPNDPRYVFVPPMH